MPSATTQTLPLEGAEPLRKERLLALLEETRERTLWLTEPLSDADAERVHDRLMSPIAWDLGHIAAFEDLWLCVRAGGLAPLRPDLMEVYDATETPRAHRGELPYLRRAAALDYLEAVRERALGALAEVELAGVGDAFVWEMVIAHEQQHNETMLQALKLAGRGVYAPRRRPLPPAPIEPPAGMVRIEGGPCELGAADDGFAYDNERPRHELDLPAFEIDRCPVTNGEFARFVADGGYARRRWWSAEGWAWRTEAGVERPLYWTDDGRVRDFERLEPLAPADPVMHVSWYEADAYARSLGKRLPTEVEWEKAASDGGRRRLPWGDEPPAAQHANLDQTAFGPAPAAAYPEGASADGVLGLVGDAWEWTASDFLPYPGFRAYPYEDYSSIFFGGDYRVLRGGSWATRPRVIRASFRNWDLPQRRQIFAGFRCAVDA